MAIIHTQRNRVYAYDQRPDDVFVRVGWMGLGDGRIRKTFVGRYQPISEYQQAVDWAVGIADQMVFPLYVVTINDRDFLNTNRFDPYRKMLANLNDQERGEMRELAITTCAEVMRDCEDPEVRADCYDVLVQLKVIRP